MQNNITYAACSAQKNIDPSDDLIGSLNEFAGPLYHRAVREAFEMSTIDFLRGVIDLVCGKGHAVSVGTIDNGGTCLIEIHGKLPPTVRGGLKRAHAWGERPRRGSIPWGSAWAVWHLSSDSFGPRLAVPSIGALVELLEERRMVLEGGEA